MKWFTYSVSLTISHLNYKMFQIYTIIAEPPSSARPVVLALRCPLDRKDEPWHLRYVGQSETGDVTKHTIIRNFVDSSVSPDIVHFLPAIGFVSVALCQILYSVQSAPYNILI